MNLLYISEDYLNSKVHHQLCNALADSDKNLNITLFCVERSGVSFKDLRSLFTEKKYNPVIEPLKGSHFWYKFWFPYKARLKWNMLLKNLDLSQIDFIHAATLFSEGIIAHRAYVYYGIPYSVAVRGSDINFYFWKMPHLWAIGREIIRCAQNVIFISPAQEKMACLLPPLEKVVDHLSEKKVVIPNGIDPFWILNRNYKKKMNAKRFLYIGRFDSNKNVELLIDSFLIILKQHPDSELHLVGVGGDRESQVLDKIKPFSSSIIYHGPIYDPTELQKIYDQCDIFTMISHSETFGLVFIEALSQGLPILYTQNQGVDGVFSDQSIGIAVDSHQTSDISQGMISLIENYDHYSEEVEKLSLDSFQWKSIADQYLQIINKEQNSMITPNEMEEDLPFISVICPVYNEKNYIRPCIDSVIESDYPKSKMELYFVDGMSPDGTADIIMEYVEKYPFIKLLKNPQKTVPYALNIGIDKAVGTLIIRLDAHAFYPKNYFSELVKWQMKLDADNVGGLCRTLPAKNTATAKAIAEAVSSKFGMGNSYFRIGVSQIRKVDTVPFGCFKREIFEKIGFFDTELVRNQDDEFNGRIIKNGGSIYLLPHVVSDYYARDTISKTAKMFYQYGLFKPLVNKKLGAPATLRQFVPPVFVLGLILGFILSFLTIYILIPYLVVLIGYLLTALDNGRKGGHKWSDRRIMFLMPVVYFMVHVSYGFGYWKGLIRLLFKKSIEVKVNR